MESKILLQKKTGWISIRHEYAHYMEHHITIPREYQWQPGLHGSAWKYCCSLVGAVADTLLQGRGSPDET